MVSRTITKTTTRILIDAVCIFSLSSGNMLRVDMLRNENYAKHSVSLPRRTCHVLSAAVKQAGMAVHLRRVNNVACSRQPCWYRCAAKPTSHQCSAKPTSSHSRANMTFISQVMNFDFRKGKLGSSQILQHAL